MGQDWRSFDIQELREITAYNELELDTIGDWKTALFLIMSDTDKIGMEVSSLILNTLMLIVFGCIIFTIVQHA